MDNLSVLKETYEKMHEAKMHLYKQANLILGKLVQNNITGETYKITKYFCANEKLENLELMWKLEQITCKKSFWKDLFGISNTITISSKDLFDKIFVKKTLLLVEI
jgi:hypothetical protein